MGGGNRNSSIKKTKRSRGGTKGLNATKFAELGRGRDYTGEGVIHLSGGKRTDPMTARL